MDKSGILTAQFSTEGDLGAAAIRYLSAGDVSHVDLVIPQTAQAIALRHGRRVEKLEIKADEVLDELKKLAFSDPGKLFDESGKLKPLSEIDERTRAALIVEVEAEQFSNGSHGAVNMKLKLADKGQNLERLGRYLKLFTDRVEHDGRVTLEQLVSGHPSDVDLSPGTPEDLSGDTTEQSGEREDRNVA